MYLFTKSQTKTQRLPSQGEAEIVLIAESVYGSSLAAASEHKCGRPVRLICPLEGEKDTLSSSDLFAKDETELIRLLQDADVIIADPLYRPIFPKNAKFVPLGHEAFSGRIYREEIPNLIADNFDVWYAAHLEEAVK